MSASGNRGAERPGELDRTIGSEELDTVAKTRLPTAVSTDGGPATGGVPAPRGFEGGDLVNGRYRVVSRLGAGGMGEVYEVEDVELGERVALKTLLPDVASDAAAVDRFRREVQLARRVTHPNVCRVLEFGTIRAAEAGAGVDVLFLTMEILRGETLTDRVKRCGPLPLPEALAIAGQLLSGLGAAHKAGVVHRDFKGPNVILVEQAGETRAVITDFGLARSTLRGSGDTGTLTATGIVVGSPAYMAPEQLTGGTIGPATDVYAFGVVLFEMVTGQRPFHGDTAMAVALKRLQEAPPSARSLRPDLPESWGACIDRCLARRPEDRYPSMTDVAADLLGSAPPSNGSDRSAARHGPGRGPRFGRPVLAVAAALGLAAIAAGVWLVRQRSPEVPAAVSASATAPAGSPKTVAVLGLRNLGDRQADWMDTAISEMLRTELGMGGALASLDGEQVARRRSEIGIAPAGAVQQSDVVRLGKALGADVVVHGTFLVLPGASETKVRVDFEARDLGGAEPLVTFPVTGTEGQLFDLVAEAGKRLRVAFAAAQPSPSERTALKAALPESTEAARLYAQGLDRLRAFDALGARDLLRKAAAADPRSPLIRAALASAWSTLGYGARAREEAERASAVSADLPVETRLTVEAQVQEATGRWADAAETWRKLAELRPGNPDATLRQAAALTSAGRGSDAVTLLAALGGRPGPTGTRLRIRLEEARADKQQALFGQQLESASAVSAEAAKEGEPLLAARGKLLEADALVQLERWGDGARAADAAHEALAALGDKAAAAEADSVRAIAFASEDRLDEALAAFRRSLATLDEIGHRQGTANQLTNIGNVLAAKGNRAAAKAEYGKALAICEETDDSSCRARTLNNIAVLYQEDGEFAEAAKRYQEAADLYAKAGARGYEATTVSNLGEVLFKARRWSDSDAAYRRASLLFQDLKQPHDAALCLVGQALAVTETGDWRRARTLLDEAAEMAGASPAPDFADRLKAARAVVEKKTPGR